MQKPDLRVINAKTKESASDVSRIVFSNSYLLFILVLVVCACFATYTLTVANAVSKANDKIHSEHLMEMKKIHDKMEVMQVYINKLTVQYETALKENQKIKENLKNDSSSM